MQTHYSGERKFSGCLYGVIGQSASGVKVKYVKLPLFQSFQESR